MRRIVLAGLLAALAAPAAQAASEPLPPQGPPPPGANDFGCRPPARHPYPVVLVHGTFGNMTESWNSITPPLKRLGYCVFALDYGNSPLPGVNGVGDIPTSARQLQTFVDHVLSATGAAKVSIVGHSQGGMMPRYLIKFLGHAGKVDDLVGLSPSNHGTTNPLTGPSGTFGCVACVQQMAGSDFLKTLNAGDQTPAPVSYTVIETRHDEVVTPYQSEFLPLSGDRVTNVLLQDRCPADPVEHVAIPGDPVAIQWMLAALGRPGPANPAFRPDCFALNANAFPDSSSVSGGGPPSQARASRPARLRLGSLAPLATGGQVWVYANRRLVRTVRVVLHAGGARGLVVGRSAAFSLTRRRHIALKGRPHLRRGRYTAVVSGRDSAGRRIKATRSRRLG